MKKIVNEFNKIQKFESIREMMELAEKQAGDKIAFEFRNEKNKENIIKIMDIAKENNLDTKVTSIDITNKNQYSIYIQEEKKRIHLGENTNLGNKMLYAISIMEKEKGIEGDIYVNGDLNNKFQPYFREKV